MMEPLIQIAVLALALLLGLAGYREVKDSGRSDEQLEKADKLDEQAEAHADALSRARTRVEELEERIVTRKKGVENVEASEPDDAVDRLRDEFGSDGGG